MKNEFIRLRPMGLYLGMSMQECVAHCQNAGIVVHTTETNVQVIADKDLRVFSTYVQDHLDKFLQLTEQTMREKQHLQSTDSVDPRTVLGELLVIVHLGQHTNSACTGMYSLWYNYIAQGRAVDQMHTYIEHTALGKNVGLLTVPYDACTHLVLEDAAKHLTTSIHTIVYWCVCAGVAVHECSNGLSVVERSELYKLEECLQKKCDFEYVFNATRLLMTDPLLKDLNQALLRGLMWMFVAEPSPTPVPYFNVHWTLKNCLFWHFVQNHTFETFGAQFVSTMQSGTPHDQVLLYDSTVHMSVHEAAAVLKLDVHYFAWLCVLSSVRIHATDIDLRVVKRSELYKLEEGIHTECDLMPDATLLHTEPKLNLLERLSTQELFKGSLLYLLHQYVEQKHGDTISEFAAHCVKQLTQRSTAD